jgi:hypothetical protein
MDCAISKKTRFVTTKQLVDMAKANVHDVTALSDSSNLSGGCQTCDKSNNNIEIAVSMNNTTQAVAPLAENISN